MLKILKFFFNKVLFHVGYTKVPSTYIREIDFFSKYSKKPELEDFDLQMLSAQLRMWAHILEKDLFMEDGKHHFREKYLYKTLNLMNIWKTKYSPDYSTYRWAKNIVDQYLKKWPLEEQKMITPEPNYSKSC